MTPDAIQDLEQRSFRAWRSLQNRYYDGWVLRLADGYTRRANSVNPIFASTLDLDEKLATCQSIYEAYALPLVFRLTPLAFPSNLDSELNQRGFISSGNVSVQVADLNVPALHHHNELYSCTISNQLTEEWLTDNVHLNKADSTALDGLRRILIDTTLMQGFFAITYDGLTVASGYAVLDEQTISLYRVVTAASHRGHGLGTQLVHVMLNWGCEQGATRAFLQVNASNMAALALYRKFGFREAYHYWYRTAP